MADTINICPLLIKKSNEINNISDRTIKINITDLSVDPTVNPMIIEKMKNSDKSITENVPNWVNLFDSMF